MRSSIWLAQPIFKRECILIGSYSRTARRTFHHVLPLQRLGGRSNRPVEALYTDTAPPSSIQAAAAETFFKTHLPTKSWTATEWRSQPHSDKAYLTPEVAFLGRSNSGKSSLLNGILMNPTLCRVGPKPGKTITMHAWSLSPIDPRSRGAKKGHKGDMEPKLTVLDMPGYGHGARGDWGRDIMKYLKSRRQLRRAFVLVNPAHGLKDHDLQMLELLRGHGISHQVIATKCDHDAVKDLPKLLHNLQDALKSGSGPGRGGPVLMTINDVLAVGGLGDGRANQRVTPDQMRGLCDVRWAILRAAGLEEYVVSLHENGGVPKKVVKLPPTTLNETCISSELSAKPPEDAATFNVFSSSSTQAEVVAPEPKAPQIGIGLDELMAMTTPSKPPTSSSSTEGIGRSSMRQRMLARRTSPMKIQPRRRA